MTSLRTDEHSGTGPLNTLFDVLATSRRRHVLRCLADADASFTLDTLTTACLERERADAAEPVRPGDRQRVRTALHHVHLPKLADTGFVVREGDVIRPTEMVREVRAVIPDEPVTDRFSLDGNEGGRS